MKPKRNPNNARLARLEQSLNWDQTSKLVTQRERDEMRLDILFILNRLGLQRNQFAAPRIVPVPKLAKPKLMRRFWNMIQGR